MTSSLGQLVGNTHGVDTLAPFHLASSSIKFGEAASQAKTA